MADDPNITKAANWLSAIESGEWVSATEVGESVEQRNSGAWVLAPVDIREACLGGCRAVLELLDQDGQKTYASLLSPQFWFAPNRLNWVCALNRSQRREDFSDRPWPWEVCAFLSPGEKWEFPAPLAREQERMVRVFLHRADAVRWGLLPAASEQLPAASEQTAAAPAPGNSAAAGKKRHKRRVKRQAPDRDSKSDQKLAPKAWLADVCRDHPRRQHERTKDYVTRLLALMQEASVTKVWSRKSLGRRIYD